MYMFVCLLNNHCVREKQNVVNIINNIQVISTLNEGDFDIIYFIM